MRGITVALALVACAAADADEPADGGAPPAAGDGGSALDAQKLRARELYQRGMASFAVDHLEQAIADFEAAFLIDPLPDLLYDIGQAHKKAKRPEKAIDYYQRYLDLRPDAPDRADVEKAIGEAKAAIAARDAVKPAPPATPLWKRWWLWTAVAVVAGGVAVALGVTLGTAYPDTTFGFTKVGP
jgi:tetratricopeptide (TPR) repeat protein